MAIVKEPSSFVYNRYLIPFPVVKVSGRNDLSHIVVHLLEAKTKEELSDALVSPRVDIKVCFLSS